MSTFTTAARQPRDHNFGAVVVLRIDQVQPSGRSVTQELRRFTWRYVDNDSQGNRERSAAALAKAQALRDQLRQQAREQFDLDYLTAQHTAFGTFAKLLDAPYTPTLRVPRLADAYDAAQAARGSDKRAGR